MRKVVTIEQSQGVRNGYAIVRAESRSVGIEEAVLIYQPYSLGIVALAIGRFNIHHVGMSLYDDRWAVGLNRCRLFDNNVVYLVLINLQ